MGNFTVADVETTGLDPQRCSILSIGAVKRKTKEEFYGECRPFDGALIDPKAMAVNGLKLDQIKDKESEAELITRFIQWVGDKTVIIGMNPYYDYSFIRAAAERAGISKIPVSHRTLDMHTLAVAYALMKGKSIPDTGFYTDAIYKMLGMAPEPRPHNALTGARMEDKAFHKLFYAVVR